MTLVNGSKVWVRILAARDGSTAAALVPGIVTDARIMDRSVIRSQTKGGTMLLNNTMVVVSYRHPPTRTPFYTERAEQVIGLTDRKEHLPIIDGEPGADLFGEVIPRARAQAVLDLARIAPAPTQTDIAAAVAEYGGAGALVAHAAEVDAAEAAAMAAPQGTQAKAGL